jgi:hypothetical protein
VTTNNSTEPHVYQSHSRFGRSGVATAVAATIAAVVATVGAIAMIIGVVGALGYDGMDGQRTALVIGLGLVGIGSGALLLVILQTWRIFTDRD